jgi:hypothetical protein
MISMRSYLLEQHARRGEYTTYYAPKVTSRTGVKSLVEQIMSKEIRFQALEFKTRKPEQWRRGISVGLKLPELLNNTNSLRANKGEYHPKTISLTQALQLGGAASVRNHELVYCSEDCSTMSKSKPYR